MKIRGCIILHQCTLKDCDRTGVVQIVSDPERTPTSYDIANRVRNEYVVLITGRVSHRPDESLNPKLATGEEPD